MKKLLTVILLLSVSPLFAEANMSPVGQWKTFDEDTGRPESIVEVYQDKNDPYVYNGKIVKSLTPPKPGESSTCDKCPEPFTGKKIQGLQFLWGFVRDDGNVNHYTGGHVLDPRNGNIYNASMTVGEDGKTLLFRGYMGISLFGGSRTWERM